MCLLIDCDILWIFHAPSVRQFTCFTSSKCIWVLSSNLLVMKIFEIVFSLQLIVPGTPRTLKDDFKFKLTNHNFKENSVGVYYFRNFIKKIVFFRFCILHAKYYSPISRKSKRNHNKLSHTLGNNGWTMCCIQLAYIGIETYIWNLPYSLILVCATLPTFRYAKFNKSIYRNFKN